MECGGSYAAFVFSFLGAKSYPVVGAGSRHKTESCVKPQHSKGAYGVRRKLRRFRFLFPWREVLPSGRCRFEAQDGKLCQATALQGGLRASASRDNVHCRGGSEFDELGRNRVGKPHFFVALVEGNSAVERFHRPNSKQHWFFRFALANLNRRCFVRR